MFTMDMGRDYTNPSGPALTSGRKRAKIAPEFDAPARLPRVKMPA